MNRIKIFFKKTPIWSLLKYLKAGYNIVIIFMYDFIKYIKISSSLKALSSKQSVERLIIINSHIVEKGLSHKNFRTRSGVEQIRDLSDAVKTYQKTENIDNFIMRLGVDALASYRHANNKYGANVDDIVGKHIPYIDTNKESLAGVRMLCFNKKEERQKMDFDTFSKDRHSIRLYEHKSLCIEKSIIKEIVSLAQTAPSACNRQSVRVNIVTDKEQIMIISDLQGGAQGFGINSAALAVITTKISDYQHEERGLPMFDAGLFALNFSYSAHFHGCDTCILNGSIRLKNENKILSIIDSPFDERLACVIAIVRTDEDCVPVTFSSRKNVDDIIRFIARDIKY